MEKLKNGMTSTDIIAIIEACGKSGVSSIRMEGFEAEWSPETTEEYIELDSVPPMQYTLPNSQDTEVEDDQFDEIQDTDDLMFTDPEAWDEIARGNDK